MLYSSTQEGKRFTLSADDERVNLGVFTRLLVPILQYDVDVYFSHLTPTEMWKLTFLSSHISDNRMVLYFPHS